MRFRIRPKGLRPSDIFYAKVIFETLKLVFFVFWKLDLKHKISFIFYNFPGKKIHSTWTEFCIEENLYEFMFIDFFTDQEWKDYQLHHQAEAKYIEKIDNVIKNLGTLYFDSSKYKFEIVDRVVTKICK